MSTPLTIEEVVSAFAQWRSCRKKLEPIPQHLLEQVKQLLKDYGPGTVGTRLGLSGARIKRLSAELNLSSQYFVPAVFPETQKKTASEMCKITLLGQKEKRIVLELKIEHLKALLPSLLDQL